MLETLMFIATNLAVFYVMYWITQNDGAARIEDQTGPIRQKSGDDYEPVKGARTTRAKARRTAR